ncbi:MAG: esterase-like activity of phytase family protein [Aggregatilineales bacterium]
MITPIGRMAGIRLVVLAMAILLAASPALTKPAHAQTAPQVTLIARAILPAESYADGPPSGAALEVPDKTINGIKLPFSSQPVGSFTGVIPGTYKTTWQFLSGYAFGARAVSGDYLMRVNLLTIDWRANGTGGGSASPGEWLTLTDPKKLVSIAKPDKDRTLTGGNFLLYGLVRAPDGSLWAGDVHTGALLHFSADGKIQKSLPLPNMPDGALQGIGLTPDGQTFLVASRANNAVTIQLLQAPTGTPKGNPLAYPLDAPGDSVRGWVMINATQALVVEQDNQQNEQAQIKRVYLVTLNGTVTKTLLADLLNISDPNNLGTDPAFNPTGNEYGLSNPFKFPFQEIDSVYPINDQTLLIANNNQFPTGTGRVAGKPADTELIQIKLASKLALQPTNFIQQ